MKRLFVALALWSLLIVSIVCFEKGYFSFGVICSVVLIMFNVFVIGYNARCFFVKR